ncbi:MAG: hypothetical protein DRQ89_15100, partial [Epsilonproteobacteria bacterium]
FRIRYIAEVSVEISVKMRVVFDGRIYDIKSAMDLHGMKKETHLICTEHKQ